MLYNFENQVLIGTVLGGSSLIKPPRGKNYYLSMRSKNDIWLQYKMAEMPTYFKKPVLHLYGGTYRCNSSCSEALTEIQESLYEGNKRTIKMEVLDSLRDIALAIWFLDGGSKTGRGRKNAYINTTKFGEEGTNIVLKYFNEIGMPCNINRDASRFKILFTVDGTTTFLKIIAHRFPTFMYDRL
jgi:hypothetical protein